MKSWALLTIAYSIAFISCAQADHEPVMILPHPVTGELPSYVKYSTGAVVYGDWGLYRPGHMQIRHEGPAVIYGPWMQRRHYFPSNGKAPAYGRKERDPDSGSSPPQKAESFRRTWTTGPIHPLQQPENVQGPAVIYGNSFVPRPRMTKP